MNKKILILIILIVILAASIGAYFIFKKPSPSEKTLYVLWAVHVEGDTQECQIGQPCCQAGFYQERAFELIDVQGLEYLQSLSENHIDSFGGRPKMYLSPAGEFFETELDSQYGNKAFRRYDWLALGHEIGPQPHKIYWSGQKFCWPTREMSKEGIIKKLTTLHQWAEKWYHDGQKVNHGLTYAPGMKLELPIFGKDLAALAEAEKFIDKEAYKLGYRISMEDWDAYVEDNPALGQRIPYLYQANYEDGTTMYKIGFQGPPKTSCIDPPRCETPENAKAWIDSLIKKMEADSDPAHLYYYAFATHPYNPPPPENYLQGEEIQGAIQVFEYLDELVKSGVKIKYITPKDFVALASPAVSSTANITVDYSKDLGAFSPYIFGTVIPPYFDQSGFDKTKEAGFKMVQIPVNVKMPSNPDDPSQYDFTTLDQQVAAAVGNGLEPMILFFTDKKPSDTNKFATFTKNVVRHLTQGWANGHKWNIRVLRFGNEPDNTGIIDPSGVVAWTGTPQEFFETYAAWAKAMKTINQNFILDTPGLMGGIKGSAVDSSWVTEFLEYAKKNNVPIDMFSVHGYGPIMYYSNYERFKLINEELKKYPNLSPIYGAPQPADDEWNIMIGDVWSGSYHKQFDTSWVASHNIAALINKIEQGLVLSVPVNGLSNGDQGGCHDFPLIDCSGNKKPAYYAFKGFNWLADTNRLSTIGTDHMNFAAIAGKSDNGIIVVISNYDVKAYLDKYEPQKVGDRESPAWMEYNPYVSQFGEPKVYNKFNLTLDNLPWTSSQKITYERYLVDDSHKLELVESETLSGSKEMKFAEEIVAPSVQVIKLTVK